MLERDRRRKARAQHAQKLARRRWLDECEKWAACPNHGLSATLSKDGNWYGTDDLFYFPQDVTATGYKARLSALVCFECGTVWRTHSNVKHP